MDYAGCLTVSILIILKLYNGYFYEKVRFGFRLVNVFLYIDIYVVYNRWTEKIV